MQKAVFLKMTAFQFFKDGVFFSSPETIIPFVVESWGGDFIIFFSILGSSATWYEVKSGATTNSLNKHK